MKDKFKTHHMPDVYVASEIAPQILEYLYEVNFFLSIVQLTMHLFMNYYNRRSLFFPLFRIMLEPEVQKMNLSPSQGMKTGIHLL